jgi:hypothetical protein
VPDVQAESCHPIRHSHSLLAPERLLAAADLLFRRSVRHALFREPDRDHEPTALATEPLAGDRRRPLDRFRCLTANDLGADPEAAP